MAFNRMQQTVNVDRFALLTALRANKEQHVKEYNEARDGFKNAMIERLKQELAKAKKGELEELDVRLDKPISHERDYQEAIDMLEVSVDQNIQLDSQMFRAYFKDEWDWSEHFKLLNSTYSASYK